MTPEERELLFRAISAGLPYCLKAEALNGYSVTILGVVKRMTFKKDVAYIDIVTDNGNIPIDYVKPYLRPMTSMTEEEVKELVKVYLSKYNSSYKYHNPISIDSIYIHDRYSWSAWIHFKTENGDIAQTCVIVGRVNWETTLAEIDWLNVHHFDYRGLIEKNLALDCTGLHIYD